MTKKRELSNHFSIDDFPRRWQEKQAKETMHHCWRLLWLEGLCLWFLRDVSCNSIFCEIQRPFLSFHKRKLNTETSKNPFSHHRLEDLQLFWHDTLHFCRALVLILVTFVWACNLKPFAVFHYKVVHHFALKYLRWREAEKVTGKEPIETQAMKYFISSHYCSLKYRYLWPKLLKFVTGMGIEQKEELSHHFDQHTRNN